MNDAATVRGRECIRDLQSDQQARLQLERASRDKLSHVLSFNKLHRNEVNAINFIEIVDRANVWMVQR